MPFSRSRPTPEAAIWEDLPNRKHAGRTDLSLVPGAWDKVVLLEGSIHPVGW